MRVWQLAWIRSVLKVAASIAALALTCLLLVSIFVFTEAGSRWAVDSALKGINDGSSTSVSYAKLEGNLFRGLKLTEVDLKTTDFTIEAMELEAIWNPFTMLEGAFVVTELIGSEVIIKQLADGGAASEVSNPVSESNVLESLPISIFVESFKLHSAVIDSSGRRFEIRSVSSTIEVDKEKLLLSDFDLILNPLFLQGEFQIVFTPSAKLDANFQWQYEESLLMDFESASGQLTVSGGLSALEVNHQLFSPMNISSAGRIQNLESLDTLAAQFSHIAEEIFIPIEGREAALFEDVTVTTGYGDKNVDWNFESKLNHDQLPDLELTGNGEFSEGKISLSMLQALSDSGLLSVNGTVDLGAGLRSQLYVKLEESEPLQYFEVSRSVEFTELNFDAQVSLELIDDEIVTFDARQMQLSARLNDNPLQGSGGISGVNGVYSIDQVLLTIEENELFINGSIGDSLEIDWSLDASSLELVDTRLEGYGAGSGSIRGIVSEPKVEAQLAIEKFGLESFFTESLILKISNTDSLLRGEVLIQDGRFGLDAEQRRFEEAKLTVEGSLESQSIEFSFLSELVSLDFSANGNGLDLENRNWSGSFSRAPISGQFGDWQKQDMATFSLSEEASLFELGCWKARGSEFCFNGSIDQDRTLLVSASLANFPLEEFNSAPSFPGYLMRSPFLPKLPSEVFVFGPARLSIQGEIPAGGAWQGNFSLFAEETQLVLSDAFESQELGSNISSGQSHSYDWESLSLSGQYDDRNWVLQSRAVLAENDVDDSGFQLEGLFEGNLAIGEDNSISGTANANFQDLGWIEAFIPEVSGIRGELSSNLIISGLLDKPLIEGNASVRGGAFTADRLGVTFQDFEISLSGDKDGSAQIAGSVFSGEGSLEFTGGVSEIYSPGRIINASVSGSDFEFINLPNLTLNITPELKVSANAENIDLSGTLEIPTLNLIVKELPNTAINVSRDVVITDYPPDRPDLAKSVEAENASLFNIPVTAQVSVNLGSDVSFEGFGLATGLQGRLDIQQLAEGNNLTYGELDIIDGSYELYRQTLEIQQGKLLFLGPYDNPGLDVRAIRKVDDITAGVQMNGTLRNIRSQLFSTPALADSDIVSVLVTGKPFSQLGSREEGNAVLNAITKFGLERGQGLTAQIADRLGLDTLEITNTGNISSSELSVGKYVTPDLFVRYGIGLFDTRSKIAVDYKLTNSLILQAETGEFQSVDLTYKVEK